MDVVSCERIETETFLDCLWYRVVVAAGGASHAVKIPVFDLSLSEARRVRFACSQALSEMRRALEIIDNEEKR